MSGLAQRMQNWTERPAEYIAFCSGVWLFTCISYPLTSLITPMFGLVQHRQSWTGRHIGYGSTELLWGYMHAAICYFSLPLLITHQCLILCEPTRFIKEKNIKHTGYVCIARYNVTWNHQRLFFIIIFIHSEISLDIYLKCLLKHHKTAR